MTAVGKVWTPAATPPRAPRARLPPPRSARWDFVAAALPGLSRRAAQENQSPSVAARIKSAMRSPAKPEAEETKSWHEEGKGARRARPADHLSNVARLSL